MHGRRWRSFATAVSSGEGSSLAHRCNDAPPSAAAWSADRGSCALTGTRLLDSGPSLLPSRFTKPQYAFYPVRAAKRVLRGHISETNARRVVDMTLPWGMPISLRPGEAIGHSIATTGIFDHCVSETLYRLTDPGDLAVDVGANIGYMTSLMVKRAGSSGRVVAVEPNPEVYSLLACNVARWRTRPGAPLIETHEVALSDRDGTAMLKVPALFTRNQGRASIDRREGDDGADPWHATVAVALRRLDDLVGERDVGVLKIDVEGHEAKVLSGAERLLAAHRVRDIVFEHRGYPTSATRFLEDLGYTLLSLNGSLFRLVIGPPSECSPWQGWEGPSYLATVARERALRRLQRRGWALPGIRWGSAARC
jgi:FkbM family methyltransferase